MDISHFSACPPLLETQRLRTHISDHFFAVPIGILSLSVIIMSFLLEALL